jgi:succinoglycan biosynthesis transport protein ExoP
MGESHNNNSLGSRASVQVLASSSNHALVPVLSAREPIQVLQAPTGLLVEYFGLLQRHRLTILATAVIGALLGFLITVPTLPVYRARTSLDIQNLNSDFMNMKDVAPTARNDGNNSSESYVQTEIKLLQSDTLRARAVKRLLSAEYPDSLTRDDLLSEVKQFLHLPGNRLLSKTDLVKDAAKNVVIKPLGVTRLVEITCDSWNAKFAADFCNVLTSEFSEQDREVRWNEAQKTSEWLSRQLADVRENLSQSEKKLETASGATGMVLRHAGGSVAAEKLDELQSELIRAEANRVTKQAQFHTSASAPPESLPMILDDPEFRDYQMKLEDLRRQIAALVPPLTEANPKVQHLRSQVVEIENSLAIKKRDLIERMKNEYDEARHREGLLAAAYNSQETKVTKEQAKEAQVSMLRHDVDSEQQLYQTLLQRVKEAGLASALQASTIRVVDAAEVPDLPIAPRRAVSTLVGILLGSLLGVAGAFIKQRTGTVLRSPGEVQRYLSLRELGVIPSAKQTVREVQINRLSVGARLLTLLGPAGDAGGIRAHSRPSVDTAMWKDRASLVTEAFRSATYSILLAGKQNERANVYVISSPNMGEGKTTISCNLGFALAQANRRVLLIDGDMRKPRLHDVMGVANGVGLRELLRGDIDLRTSILSEYCRPSHLPNLSVISSGQGTEDPGSLLHSSRCREVVDFLAGHFDVILIDSPPILHIVDARIFGGMATGAILVFRSRMTNRETAATARDLFLNDGVTVLGTILNDFSPDKEGKSNYYGSYYAYQQDARAASGSLTRRGGSL